MLRARPFLRHGRGRATRVLALVALGAWALASGAFAASPEAVYEQSVAQLDPIDVVSGQQYEQARRREPGRALQLSGAIQGIVTTGERRTMMLQMVDGEPVQIRVGPDLPDIRTTTRVRCLVKPADPSYGARLDLVDITLDRTPLEVLQEAARGALKIPVSDEDELQRAAAEMQRIAPMPERGGGVRCSREAIRRFNPRLSAAQVETFASAIERYCAEYSVDPVLIVAMIAAESRFDPNARSHKGAMGLGQLMPATAAAHGVDPWDPVQNLRLAIRIMRRNLDKYGGDLYRALAAYNAGVGAVDRHGGVPPYRETREYLWRIYEYICWLRHITPKPRPW